MRTSTTATTLQRTHRSMALPSLLMIVLSTLTIRTSTASQPHEIRRQRHPLTFHHKPNHRRLGTRGNRLQWGDDDDDLTYADLNGVDHNQDPLESNLSGNTESFTNPDGTYFNESSCKPGNKRPCSPSAMPSVAPSPPPTEPTTPGPSIILTLPPTPRPSLTLTLSPTQTPTPPPTQLPTVPPTWILTRSPSKLPSTTPTLAPTGIPSSRPTVMSSKGPTSNPTRAPTTPPTPSPTQTPTKRPTPFPTRFPTGNPTARPTPNPTPLPTRPPSPGPTVQPSVPPTRAPSIAPSMVPTTAVQSQTSLNGTSVTKCSSPPLGEGYSNVQLLAFQYNMYMATTSTAVLASNSSSNRSASSNTTDESSTPRLDNATAILEQRIHRGLVTQFLTCNPDAAVLAETNPSSFRITAVMSDPADQVNHTAVCDTSKDPATEIPTECWVVTAQLAVDAFFPTDNARRRFLRRLQLTLANPEIVDSIGDYLNTSMANDDFIASQDGDDAFVPVEDRVVQISFQGFLNVLNVDDDSTSSGSGINSAEGAIGANRGNTTGNTVLMGSAALGGVALLLLVVALLSVRQNRNRQEAYLRQLDDLNSQSDMSSQASHILGNGDNKVHLVREEDYDRFEAEETAIEMELPAAHSDVHFCSSATCPVCRHRVVGPTFVSTSFEDLSPRKRPNTPNGRRYEAPDTVLL